MINNPALGDKHLTGQVVLDREGDRVQGFNPAVFARLVSEAFNQRAKGEAGVKVTAPLELVGTRKARHHAWEADVVKTKLLAAGWPKGAILFRRRRCRRGPAFRVMIAEYYVASGLVCHGSPKGKMDLTSYPKEGGKLGDLGTTFSITLFQ